jgi:hypothetical protein
MRKVTLFAVLLLAVAPLAAEMIAKLPQVVSPICIALTQDRIYVVDDPVKVHIYVRRPGGIEFVKTFGREGDAPGEFLEIFKVQPLQDRLEIVSHGKISTFSLDGRFRDELKLPIRFFKDGIFRIGDGYVARDFRFDDSAMSVSIQLHSKDYNMRQELAKHRIPLGSQINLVPEYYSVRVAGDLAYVIESGKETKITVFDQAGAKRNEVVLPLKPVLVGPELKETLLAPLRNEPEWRSGDEALYCFPEWTPGLDYFNVVDGKFIVRTYEHRENAAEFIIFDLQGKELQRLFLPNIGCLSHNQLFSFFQDRFYCLQKNLATGGWELHEVKVN